MHSFQECHNIVNCLKRFSNEKNLAIAISRCYLKSLKIQKNIFCFDTSHNIRNYLRTFWVHSNFTTPFNNILRRIVETGLVVKWQKIFQVDGQPKKNRMKMNSISIEELSGVCIIYIIIIALGIIAMCAEEIIYRINKSESRGKFWEWASIIIDGDRHFFILKTDSNPRGSTNFNQD